MSRLPDEHLRWLRHPSRRKHFAHLLADHYQREYSRTGDGWNLARASAWWRQANQPDVAVQLTDGRAFSDVVLMSAILNTRGGAFRDLKNLAVAEECAWKALDHYPDSPHAYNLLGAIYYQRGQPGKGDQYFARAEALGSKAAETDGQIRSALERADVSARQRSAEHLLRKDRSRYPWAAQIREQLLGRLRQ